MKYYEDFYIGEKCQIGTHKLTSEEVVKFREKYDRHPVYLNLENTNETIIEKLNASGWYLNAIFMGLLANTFKRESWDSLGSPGIDFTRWPIPARPNDKLTGELEVLAKRVSKTRPFGLVHYRTSLVNQHEECVLHSEGTGIFSLKPNHSR